MLQKLIFSFTFILLSISFSFGQKKEFDKAYTRLELIVNSDVDSSTILVNQLKNLSKKINSSNYYSQYYSAEGLLFQVQKKFKEAMNSFETAYSYAKKTQNHARMGIILNNMSVCFNTPNTAKQKLDYLLQAKEEFLIVNDKTWLVNTDYNLAIVYHDLGEIEKSLISFKDTEKRYLELNKPNHASYAMNAQGILLFDQKKYLEAIELFEKANTYLDMNYDPVQYAVNFIQIAQCLIELNRLDEAKSFVRQAEEIGIKENSIEASANVALAYLEIFKKEKNIDSVIFYADRAKFLEDSLKWTNYDKELATAETKFKSQLKNEKIELQQKNIAQHKASILKLTILSILLGIIIIGIVALWTRLNKRSKQLQVALTEKEVLLREIHHRVKNNMQVVSSLLNMHVRKVKDEDSKRILEDGSERIQAMALIQKNLYPHSDLKSISLNEYLHTLSHQLFDNYNIYNANVQLKTQLDEIYVDVEKLIPIGLIVNEILCNSVKHAFKLSQEGEITLKLIDAGTKIQLEIGDSGQNFPDDWDQDSNQSLGMKFIKIFSHKLQAKLSIRSTPTTLITLNFPRI